MAGEGTIVVDRVRVVRGGRVALDEISAAITDCSVTGLFGPGGRGKSTLGRSIVGVQRVDVGRVLVLDGPAGSPPPRRRVAYTTQAPSVALALGAANLRRRTQ